MKPTLGVLLGDTHCGSDTALAVPGFRIASAENRPYAVSDSQQWLYDSWRDFRKKVKAAAKGKRLFVGIGGDLTDGAGHHGTTETTGTNHDAVQMAIALLKPFVEMADDCLGVLGTESHVGNMGENDAAVYDALGIEYAPSFRYELGGRLLWWAHEGLSVGRSENTLENSMILTARDISMTCKRTGERQPDAIVAHHTHVAPDPIQIRGVTAAIVPCWQLSTYYGSQHWPHRQPTIGGLLWHVNENRFEKAAYEQEPQIRHSRPSARAK